MRDSAHVPFVSAAEQFSVYNVRSDVSQCIDNPLRFLLPEDSDHGWHVARNLLKPLNHLDFLRRKEKIAVSLNLHNTVTPPDLFNLNYHMLAAHQAREISTSKVINKLVHQLQKDGVRITIADVQGLLREYATVHHMEFHPSDVCNLACRGCTYGHDDPERKPQPINYPLTDACTGS